MLLGGLHLALAGEHLQRGGQALAGLGGLDHVVHIAQAGRIAAVREILSIPDGYMPLNVIPVVYPAENPPAKDKWNPAKIHYDKW